MLATSQQTTSSSNNSHDKDALSMALKLAITAPSDNLAELATELADHIALQRKAGLTTQQAITDVLGQKAWDLISANYNTPEEINHAIAEAF